jgi:hypothetical protein
MTINFKRPDNNIKDGHNIRSKYWIDYKKSLPNTLPNDLFEISIGLILGDGTLYRSSGGVKMKLEYGPMHRIYLLDLLKTFQKWTFYDVGYPYERLKKDGTLKSYSFRTSCIHSIMGLIYDFWQKKI